MSASCRANGWRIGDKNHSTETQLRRALDVLPTRYITAIRAGFYSRVELALGSQQNVLEFLHGSGVGGRGTPVSVLVYVHINMCACGGQDSFRCHSDSFGFCFVYFWFFRQGFSV